MVATAYLVAKADRGWKNISQHQDERARARRTERQGRNVAWLGGGAGLIGLSGISNTDPELSNLTYEMRRAKQSLKRPADLSRKTWLKDVGRSTSRVATKNPWAALAAAGAGGMAAGTGMVAGGRLKARHHEREITRLRRRRASAESRPRRRVDEW